MPLHDWSEDFGWENFHAFWIFCLADHIQPRLPAGFQLVIGSYRRARLRMAAEPDLAVGSPSATSAGPLPAGIAPDDEVAVASVDPQSVIQIRRRGEVVAVVELVSPGNKDRPSERAGGTARYAGYVRAGINLLLVDLHATPAGFSFPDAIGDDLGLGQPPVPPPAAVAYRVGDRAGAGGSYIAVWRRPCQVGHRLPVIPLPLAANAEVTVDLEDTYMQAARRAYLPPVS